MEARFRLLATLLLLATCSVAVLAYNPRVGEDLVLSHEDLANTLPALDDADLAPEPAHAGVAMPPLDARMQLAGRGNGAPLPLMLNSAPFAARTVRSAADFDAVRFTALMTSTASAAESAFAQYEKKKAAYDSVVRLRDAIQKLVETAFADAETAGDHKARGMVNALETDDHASGIIPKLLLMCERDGPGFADGQNARERKTMWAKHYEQVNVSASQLAAIQTFQQVLSADCSANGVPNPSCMGGWCYRATDVLRKLRLALTSAAIKSRSDDTGEQFDSSKFKAAALSSLLKSVLGPAPVAPSPPPPPAPAGTASGTASAAPGDIFNPNQKLLSKL